MTLTSNRGDKTQVSKNNSPNCPICGNLVFPKFTVPCDYRKPYNSQGYNIYWCQTCDYGMTENRPSPEEVKNFYTLDNYYTHSTNGTDDRHETTGDASTSTNMHQNISFFDRLRIHISYRLDAGEDLDPQEVTPLLKVEQPSICEIGCGNGKNLAKFQQSGYAVFGVEPDSAAREVAQTITPNIFAGTAEELPKTITERQYDIVLMSHVLEHCLDINTVMSNVREVLKDGGIYIVEIPNCNSLGFQTYQGEWPWSDIPRHLNFFTRSSLDKTLKKHGFKVELVKYSGFCRQFSNNWLNDEKEIWTAFAQHSLKQQKKPNFRSRAWKLLFRSMFASNSSKYDSIRLVGVK